MTPGKTWWQTWRKRVTPLSAPITTSNPSSETVATERWRDSVLTNAIAELSDDAQPPEEARHDASCDVSTS